ncbi:hypothetical protein AQJ46_48445 [Streptomyces canus]|uniref:CHAT domain-containing protein n=1 Tax=Streptomyces canus TaxID=58343 RepID=A0A101RKM8_9ACTN|nr:CHAT domain-containing protein [Streptomyces canus]KUN57212.1 hypothetical protein AQJ46_48445 [Streptomyces canus]
MADRLRRVEETRDLSLVLAPDAVREAHALAELLSEDDDLQVRYVLGWFHLWRSTALRAPDNDAELADAVRMFTPAFLASTYDLPTFLLPLIAHEAFDQAYEILQGAEASSDPGALSAAVDLWQRMVESMDPDSPLLRYALSYVGHALLTRFRRTGTVADLDTAVDRLQAAADATPADHSNHAGMLSDLGMALLDRFKRVGAVADLDAAVNRLQEALDAIPEDHTDRPEVLNNLGLALRDRFGRTGSMADLDTAIDHLQEALDATPGDHTDPAAMLSNLGMALRDRFERDGAMADLDTAIDHLQEAVDATPAHHSNRGGRLTSLGIALKTRFGRTGAVADLDTAIDHFQEAVSATPAHHPERAERLSAAGNALVTRFGQGGAVADLHTAIDRLQEAVDITPASHTDRMMYLSNLAGALRDRFGRDSAVADLDAAIDRLQEAVDTLPADHANRAAMLSNLAGALRARFEHAGAVTDREDALRAWSGALETRSAPSGIRAAAGWTAAGVLAQAGDYERAATAAEKAVRLLPQVAPRRLERTDQQHAVGGFAGLASTAAALALAAPGGTATERAERSLALLEAGRAVLLSQALETRSDLADLRTREPELARDFIDLRERLDQPAGHMRDRRRLAAEFMAILTEIRKVAGFGSFALPPSVDELKAEAAQGPVAIFNISGYRSDALLLTAEGVTSVPMPELAPGNVIAQVNAFRTAQRLAASGADAAERVKAQAAVIRILEWLWDAAAGPVMTALNCHARPSQEHEGHAEEAWPRVWWAPGGLLGQLPVHAAGYHKDRPDDPNRRTVMDRVVSSYTPTVRALRYAREQVVSQPDPPPAASRALIVAMPTTPGLPGHGRLHFVEEEAAMLQARLPNHIVLREPNPEMGTPDWAARTPTRTNVLAHLPECTIAHFACHGASDPADPSKSLLLLHDHAKAPLTVASLAPVDLDQAQLAYLSACRTAAVDATSLLDEAIHRTSAFQLAGFSHVIGTLWEIDDQVAVRVAKAFYDGLNTDSGVDCRKAAKALHDAVRQVRDGCGLPPPLDRTHLPLLWAAYVHAGA